MTALDVLGAGLVSPVGLDAATSCASARAGIQRVSELSLNAVDVRGEDVAALGQQIDCLTTGFRHDGRLLRLLSAALGDPGIRSALQRVEQAITVYVLIPASFDDEEDGQPEPNSAPWSESPTRPRDIERGLRMATVCLAGVGGPPVSDVVTVTVGAASMAVALADIERRFAQEPGLALIVAADSLVDLHRARALSMRARLKTDRAPTGVFPGEAAGAMLVAAPRTTRELASSRDLGVLGRLAEPRFAQLPRERAEQVELRAEALSSLCQPAGSQPQNDERSVWVLPSLNGEEIRALEWGLARVRAWGARPCETWVPALSFGDIGTTTGVAAAVLALQAFGRCYAAGEHACVLGLGDGAFRSVFWVSR